ncbi:MAG: hydantoinase B/oxoprolinase family protein [Burkholderiaceae bacterium]
MRAGDVIATNDPWQGSGHIYDINVMRPVFKGERLIGYTMSITHLPDIGGLGFSATARQVFEEGLRIPVWRIVEQGQVDHKLFDLIAANVRTPAQTLGDLHSNIACNEVGGRLLLEFMAEAGLDDLEAIADAIVESSEQAIRGKIAEMPDGVYRSTFDIEGVHAPVRLACAVHIQGDAVEIDFDGTSAAVDVAINVPLAYAKAFAVYTFKCITVPGLPNNQGCVSPITVRAPSDCILNPLAPRPTGGRHIIGHCVTPLLMGALTQAVPGEVQADSGMLNLVNVQGKNDRDREVSSIFFACGGFGAMNGVDGYPTLPSPTNMTGVPIEVWEDLTSMTILRKRLLPDTGGAGRSRGGVGQEIVMRNDSGHPMTLSCLAAMTDFAPRGFLGGSPGSLRRYEINGDAVHPKGRHLLAPGDLLRIVEPGGGGFGPPGERAPERIREDIRQGFVTLEGALRDYGVRIE